LASLPLGGVCAYAWPVQAWQGESALGFHIAASFIEAALPGRGAFWGYAQKLLNHPAMHGFGICSYYSSSFEKRN
jgi:hypothetical protein